MQRPPFTDLARVYDAIMSDVDYEDWAEFVLREARARGWNGGPALDLGCGTGNASFPVFARGVEVEGLDASAEMLAVARDKLPPVPFHEADFTDFDLGRTFALVYSVFDSLNNLLEPASFVACARRVRAHLEPGGLFVFDANTTLGLSDLWESGRAEGWAGDVYYRWEHDWDETTGLARVDAYCEVDGRGFTETHFERPYDAAEVAELLREAGFASVEAIEYPSGDPAPEDASRIWVVARAAG